MKLTLNWGSVLDTGEVVSGKTLEMEGAKTSD